jgi:hypothetical protein
MKTVEWQQRTFNRRLFLKWQQRRALLSAGASDLDDSFLKKYSVQTNFFFKKKVHFT